MSPLPPSPDAAPDLGSGLPESVEAALLTPPPDQWRFAENFLVAAYAPGAGIGLWAHLGTWPDDFGLWEDQLLVSLPGDDGLLWSFGYHRTPAECRPAGGMMALRCVEPFRRWRLTVDGVAVDSPYEQMRSGRVRDGDKRRLEIALELVAAAPVWDPAGGRSAVMAEQVWATQHYQQLVTATGTLTVDGTAVEFVGPGLRDHSRGPRGHATDRFGGHQLVGAAFDDGRAFGLLRMWQPDGTVTLDRAYVVLDGTFHDATVLEAPGLRSDLPLRDEPLALVLESPRGRHTLRGTTVGTTLATALTGGGMAFGADSSRGETVFAQGFARWEWDGAVAHGLTERSDRPG